MAESLIINDTNYAGEAAAFMITRAVVDIDTVNKGCIMVKDGIKKEYTIPRIEVANIMQHRAATPISQGTVTVDGNILFPKDYMSYIEFNPRDFEAHWFAYQLSPTLLERTLPLTAENFMIFQFMKRVNEFNELQLWRGRTAFDPANGGLDPTIKGQLAGDAVYQYFNGLIYKLLSDSGTIQIGSAATLTTSNILTVMNSIYYAVPQALVARYGDTGLKFLMNIDTQRIYEDALTTQSFKNNDTTEKGINRYKGYNVVSLAGMPDNTIVCCIAQPDTDSSLWLGLNSKDDEQSIKMREVSNNSELWFVKMLLKADVQFGFSDQVVLYTTIIA